MGWLRTLRYTKIRIIRLSDSSQKIALGLAIGAGVSFSPLLGTHFIQAGFFAYLTRSNFLASLIGTFVGNPWTFPFMWWASISFGSFLFQLVGLPASASLPDDITMTMLWDIIKHEPVRIFAPWFVGGYLLGLASVPIYYVFFYHLVNGAKAARKKARERSIHRVAKNMTGQKK
jgi:uncharacterized protein (DUF2062 family)